MWAVNLIFSGDKHVNILFDFLYGGGIQSQDLSCVRESTLLSFNYILNKNNLDIYSESTRKKV